MTSDKLVRDIIQVVADNLRLGADPQKIIANTLDQRSFPACRDGAERVPSMASDHAEFGGFNAKLLFNLSVRLRGRLMTLYGVHAKEPFKKGAIPAYSI